MFYTYLTFIRFIFYMYLLYLLYYKYIAILLYPHIESLYYGYTHMCAYSAHIYICYDVDFIFLDSDFLNFLCIVTVNGHSM